jgi:hypothetical protein
VACGLDGLDDQRVSIEDAATDGAGGDRPRINGAAALTTDCPMAEAFNYARAVRRMARTRCTWWRSDATS